MTKWTTTVSHTWRRLLGATVLTATGTGALWLGTAHLLDLLRRIGQGSGRGIDAATAAVLVGLGLVLLAWYVLSGTITTLCLAVRLTGLVWSGGESLVRRAGAPAVRRLLGGGAGAVLVAGSLLGPAHAADGDDGASSQVHLTWTPTQDAGPGDGDDDDESSTPDDPYGTHGEAEPQPAPESEPDHEGEPDHQDPPDSDSPTEQDDAAGEDDPPAPVYLVQPGDTLWSVAAQALGEQADPAEIADWWPRWYRTNIDVIGDNPDLIHPGQELSHPEGRAS